MKTLACCRRRPQDFSIDMDQEPDSKHQCTTHLSPSSPLLPFLVLSFDLFMRCS
jgi:hypothetical protein